MNRMNIKVINAQQAKSCNVYKNVKLKLLKGVILIQIYTTYLCICWYTI